MLGLGIVGTIIVIVVVVWLIRRVWIGWGVQSSWSGVDPIAVRRSSDDVYAPGTASQVAWDMGDAGFEAAAVTYDEMTAEYGRMTAQDAFSC